MGHTPKTIYRNEKNNSRVFELNERLHTLKLGDKIVSKYYSTFLGTLDVLDIHRPLVTNLKILRQYRHDFTIAKLLYGLDPSFVDPSSKINYYR